MPFDDLAQDFDDTQGAHPGVCQDGLSGVAEAEPSDHDVEICTRDAGERDIGECDLSCSEEARHEEFIAELCLVDVDLQSWFESTSKANLAQRRRPPVELLETCTHRVTFRHRSACQSPRALEQDVEGHSAEPSSISGLLLKNASNRAVSAPEHLRPK